MYLTIGTNVALCNYGLNTIEADDKTRYGPVNGKLTCTHTHKEKKITDGPFDRSSTSVSAVKHFRTIGA